MTVSVGDAVTWTNNDSVAHDVTADSFSCTFTRATCVTLTCTGSRTCVAIVGADTVTL